MEGMDESCTPEPRLLKRWASGDACGAVGVEELNAGCFCVSVDEHRLTQALETELGSPEIANLVRERCPHLFSARPVFVAHEHIARMAQVVRAIESVAALPAYREAALSRAPAIAGHAPGRARSVFFGYDFHVAGDKVGLIEVNTNAGGAMLNAVLARAHRACCLPVERLGASVASAQAFERAIVDMFHAEWRLAGRSEPLTTIAIVDTEPQAQYLYPEFLLFRRLFERSGLRVVIADPKEFSLHAGRLHAQGVAIDLVYNRLTDFYFEQPDSAALKAAYESDAAVITPHPQAHALYADKRNLALLSDPDALQALGAPADVRDVLAASVPRTFEVTAGNADDVWARRKQLFFKPFAGYGSRAAYRGDKITQRVWSEIAAGGYVAQDLVVPGERKLDATADRPMKFDLREYVYDGRVQWSAARLYQGQTTNFRTPGGGFAPVYEAP